MVNIYNIDNMRYTYIGEHYLKNPSLPRLQFGNTKRTLFSYPEREVLIFSSFKDAEHIWEIQEQLICQDL